jgi:arylsulfatase A-like enzyme
MTLKHAACLIALALLSGSCKLNDPSPSYVIPSDPANRDVVVSSGELAGDAALKSTVALTLRPPPLELPPALLVGASPPKNLLIISVDTLRSDAIGRYGGGDDTPFLDARLSEGMALDDFQSCSNSTPISFICLYTGKPPHEWGFQLKETSGSLEGIPSNLDWASQLFSRSGFRTGTVTSSPMMGDQLKPFLPSFQDSDYVQWEAPNVTDAALELSDKYASLPGRWMLHIHYMDPHSPYTPPEDVLAPLVAGLAPPDPSWTFGHEWVRSLHVLWEKLEPDQQLVLQAHLRARYRALVRYVDSEMARLWKGLESRGMLDDTLVVFWSDHGEQFGERGRWAHGWNIFQEELGSFCGFWAKGMTPGAFAGPTDVTDVLPTALTALGLAADPKVATAMEAMTGYVVGTAPPSRPRFVLRGDRFRSMVSARAGRYALVSTIQLGSDTGAQLYDMSGDRAQRTDIRETAPEEFESLRKLLLFVLPTLSERVLAN